VTSSVFSNVGFGWNSSQYARGDIVRYRETWGVVRRSDFVDGPSIDWWVGQYNAQYGEQWYPQNGCRDGDISAPFSDDYDGIPNEVWARAAMYRLIVDDVEMVK
jgi:hypothetical protein